MTEENNIIGETEVQASRHSTHIRKSVEQLIEQDNSHKVGENQISR